MDLEISGGEVDPCKITKSICRSNVSSSTLYNSILPHIPSVLAVPEVPTVIDNTPVANEVK